MQKLNI